VGVIADIKVRLQIEDIVGRTVQLKRAGHGLRGLCLFHEEKTPSFFVFPDSQRAKCFGCGWGGDLIDFEQKRNGWDLPTTLQELAREAGVEWRESPEQQAARELERAREAIFGVAAEWLHVNLLKSPQALAYCAERGFEDELIKQYQLGFFGEDWGLLRDALAQAGLDVQHPAAVALVGFRGDVTAWGRAWGIEPEPHWIRERKIPALRPGLLIYPHWLRGRVTYLSGRVLPPVDQVKSWNPSRTLVGEKQPFFNQVWETRKSDLPFMIVEGAACALTLGLWGMPGVALLGAAPTAAHLVLAELERVLKFDSKRQVALALDNDAAGRQALCPEGDQDGWGAALLRLGVSPLKLSVVAWPEVSRDANGWLQAGSTAQLAQGLAKHAPNWIEFLTQRARSDEDAEVTDEGVQAVFAALATLNAFEISRVRNKVSTGLGIRKAEFDTYLKAARREAGQAEDGKPRYLVSQGRVCHRYYDRSGNEVVEPLSNFEAQIVEEVELDDGADVRREFVLHGKMYNGEPLAPARIPATEFGGMTWVAKHWGARSIVEAGASTRDRLRAAIQHLSSDIKRETVFTHTGWREIQGRRVFLTQNGATPSIGADVTMRVELDRDLDLYQVPPQADDPQNAMQLSLSFLDLAPRAVTWPLWGAMFLAPLRELINLAFVLWIFGPTGSMKSTLTALAMNHYGPGFDDKHLPAGFIDTANRLEQKAFVLKDSPLVIDDYAPQKDRRSHQEYVNAAHRIVRAAGNLAGRGRLRADATARTTYQPRGLIMVTGEDIPTSEGVVGRLFIVEMSRGAVDKARLTVLQQERARLSHALAGYLTWCSTQWTWLATHAGDMWRQARVQAYGDGVHLRLPEAVAGLFLGVEMGLRYARDCGALTEEERQALRAEAWQTLRTTANSQAERAQEEKPERLFLAALRDLLAQGVVFLAARNNGEEPLGGAGPDQAELLGWYDRDRYYLLSATYNRICRYYSERGDVFPVGEPTLRKMFYEGGLLERDGERYTKTLSVNGQTQRVMVLRRPAIMAWDV